MIVALIPANACLRPSPKAMAAGDQQFNIFACKPQLIMRLGLNTSAWWGPPKKFDTNFKERRISWLELFYDLVYVIAISRITHHLSQHITLGGFIEYACLFILVFWG
ncbi:MAG TPA: low temperature requirement protein A, partial [Chitinophagaceae bacterium]|nr:low temperature requirement protein A [Chitinophagaceae bacterium]